MRSNLKNMKGKINVNQFSLILHAIVQCIDKYIFGDVMNNFSISTVLLNSQISVLLVIKVSI